MPSPFWGALAGVVLFAVALFVSFVFGRGLARTKTNLTDLQRLLLATRRFNNEIVAAAKRQSPSIDIAQASKEGKYKLWSDG
jgi:hypothetical protein